MWFKNLAIYRFSETFTLSPNDLDQQMESMCFKSCTDHEAFSFGWSAPLGNNSEKLVHQVNGVMMLCATREEKVLPNSVITEILTEKILEKEDKETRKLSKKERSELKDEIIFNLLPRAFSFSKKTFAYIDPIGGWLVVDASSAKKAEELISFLRKNLGSLPVIPINSSDAPINTMTQWLADNDSPQDLLIEDECELRAPEESGSIIRCKRQDLSAPEIKQHLDIGKQVIKLAVSWSDRLSFIVDENLSIKRLKFLERIQDKSNDIDAGTPEEQFDADFTIMTEELSHFLPRLLAMFGGEATH